MHTVLNQKSFLLWFSFFLLVTYSEPKSYYTKIKKPHRSNQNQRLHGVAVSLQRPAISNSNLVYQGKSHLFGASFYDLLVLPCSMEPARFRYMPEDDDLGEEEESGGGCFLDIYAHEARGVHNICIYGEQDVYARFSLTSGGGGGDRSTRAAVAAGASPRFEERLRPLRLRRAARLGGESLKCELWMRSCDARLLEDQLLGFALVPLAAVAAAPGARLDSRDFALSSTDLFHSPAGSVRLSLALRSGSGAAGAGADEAAGGLQLELSSSPAPVDEDNYSRVEFPDLNVARENLDMAAQYLPFLHLGNKPAAAMDEDLEMGGENPAAASSMDGSKNASASTTTTASDDRATISISAAPVSPEPDTPTSSGGKAAAGKGKEFEFPLLGDIDMGAEQGAMQRQIMEMYVKSMQQFTESLGRMKLPMELDGGGGGVVQNGEKPAPEAKAKKDGARVFYGSRAFF